MSDGENKGYKYLIKNIGLLTISSFATKILAFFLVPLYTSFLSTSDYGVYELFSTSIALLIPIFTLNIQEGVLRFALNNDKEGQSNVFSFGVKVSCIGILFTISFVLINHYFSIIKLVDDYALYFILMYISFLFNHLIFNFTRGLEKVKDIAIAGVLSSVVAITLNIVLLVPYGMGLKGYFIANITAGIIPTIYLWWKNKLWGYFNIKNTSRNLNHDVLKYSIPLLFNSIGWWINDASDRFVVTGISGIDANGIYSVAYKIPTILSVFQTIFNQAWVLSSVKEYDSNDENGFFSKTYNTYNALMVCLCAVIIIFSRVIARVLYAKEFYNAWVYTPFLTIAVVFGATSGLVGGLFAAAKDSRAYGISTVIGAGFNIILNIILVNKYGPIGAALATVFSYILIWAIRLVCVKKYISFKMYLFRDLCSYALLFVLSVFLLSSHGKVKYSVECILVFATLLGIYRKEYVFLIKNTKKFICKKLV